LVIEKKKGKNGSLFVKVAEANASFILDRVIMKGRWGCGASCQEESLRV
jgi:hypothetical protein